MYILGIISIILLFVVLKYIFQFIFWFASWSASKYEAKSYYRGFRVFTPEVLKNEEYFDVDKTLYYKSNFPLCSFLCNTLENETAKYMKNPIILNKTEVGKFCVALIGIEVYLGNERDKTIKDLLSYFMDIQRFFLKVGRPHCYNFFQESWLLTECEFLFGNSHKEILEEIRQIINDRNYVNDNSEIYYQPIYPYRPYRVSIWRGMSSSAYREIFNRRYTALSYMQRHDRYTNIFWYTYEEEPNRVEYLQHTYTDRDKALTVYLQCLSNVLSSTCYLAIKGLNDHVSISIKPKEYLEMNFPEADEEELHQKYNEPLNSSIQSEIEIGCIDIPPIREYDTNSEKSVQQEQPPEPPHRETRQPPNPPQPPQPDTADTLIDIGLAHIGRTTTLDNPYITPEQTQARHNIERPFLKLLAEQYTDADTRKNLSRHFMLYKEVTLFMIFTSVLRNNKPLHTKVRSRLKVRLSQGLPSKVIAKRNEYWRKLSDKFNESYTRTKDLPATLEYVFWSILPEKLKGEGFADLTNNGYLKQIFNYTREALTKEYNNLKQKQTI